MLIERGVATGESPKLTSKYKGPYMVTKELSNDRYVLQDIPEHQRALHGEYASDRMKPWCRSSEDNLNLKTDEGRGDFQENTPGIEDDTKVRMTELSELQH